jgi:hypothetical protein
MPDPGNSDANWLRAEVKPVTSVFELIQIGRPVVLGLKLTPGLMQLNSREALTCDGNPHHFVGLHAVCAVGIKKLPDDSRGIVVRNSWGTSWGQGGYAFLHESYLRHDVEEYLLIDPKGDYERLGTW